MKEIYRHFLNRINGTDLIRRTEKLAELEIGQTFRHYHLAAKHIFKELETYNIPNAELLMFPADCRTVYEDKRMPIAWDATIGKLTLCDEKQTAAADY